MSLTAIRFRVQDGMCVLQVLETLQADSDYYGGGRSRSSASWRDASPEDLLEVAKFTSDWSGIEARMGRLESDISTLRAASFNTDQQPNYPGMVPLARGAA